MCSVDIIGYKGNRIAAHFNAMPHAHAVNALTTKSAVQCVSLETRSYLVLLIIYMREVARDEKRIKKKKKEASFTRQLCAHLGRKERQ